MTKYSKSVGIIVASIFLVPAIAFTSFRFFREGAVEKMLHPKYQIDTIIQTGLVKEGLSTLYLSELLKLSVDKATNFFAFDVQEAEASLRASPVIEEARVEKREPNAVYIDYTIRRPFFLLADFHNIAMDEKGHTFPLTPYFPPVKLPELYLGLTELPPQVTGEKFRLALAILSAIERLRIPMTTLKWIDVSNAFHQSYGKKETVLIFVTNSTRHFLRLHGRDFAKGLENYLLIRSELQKEGGDRVIDLRIPDLAFFSES